MSTRSRETTPTPAPLVGILDYGMGNIRSVENALQKMGANTCIIESLPLQTDEPQALVLPGVGALGDCMEQLRHTGLDRLVQEWIQQDKLFLGVCLGMQALFDSSDEGDAKGLGIVPGKVKYFNLKSPYKVPHMGWNTVQFLKQTPLNEERSDTNTNFYFVHSYYCEPRDENVIWAESDYGHRFTCAIQFGNCYAVQFHPEKSQSVGLNIYRNFIRHAAVLSTQNDPHAVTPS